MLSHVSTIILHHFYVFCRTKLLTRCLVPVSYFYILENLFLEIFSELDENLRELFLRQDEDGFQRAASEAPDDSHVQEINCSTFRLEKGCRTHEELKVLVRKDDK